MFQMNKNDSKRRVIRLICLMFCEENTWRKISPFHKNISSLSVKELLKGMLNVFVYLNEKNYYVCFLALKRQSI
jgi:hypothetical protein